MVEEHLTVPTAGAHGTTTPWLPTATMCVICVAPPALADPRATSSAQGPPVKWKRLTPTKLRPSAASTAAPMVWTPSSSGPASVVASMVRRARSTSSTSGSVSSRAEGQAGSDMGRA
ncbi:hypothetical protein ASG73_06295 [Janibacter sp. Soil728]|nr:hypothetical protein ASG73_06295 [Janibacter sp. Soil728]